jgi:hypothetical protein
MKEYFPARQGRMDHYLEPTYYWTCGKGGQMNFALRTKGKATAPPTLGLWGLDQLQDYAFLIALPAAQVVGAGKHSPGRVFFT